jgi:hypothetical protein
LSSRRAPKTILAFLLAKYFAVTSPIPDEAPVIKTNKPIRDHSRVGLFIFTSNTFTYGSRNASK